VRCEISVIHHLKDFDSFLFRKKTYLESFLETGLGRITDDFFLDIKVALDNFPEGLMGIYKPSG
jgi:hypothetical protein